MTKNERDRLAEALLEYVKHEVEADVVWLDQGTELELLESSPVLAKNLIGLVERAVWKFLQTHYCKRSGIEVVHGMTVAVQKNGCLQVIDICHA